MLSCISVLAVLALGGAALCDVAFRRIPDAFCALLAIASIAARLTEGLAAAAASLAAAAILFAVLFALFLRGVLGGGDVKLATAAALGLPPLAVWDFVVATALSGGALSLLYLAGPHLPLRKPRPAGRGKPLLARIAAAETWRLKRRGPLPYGVAIAAGFLLSGNLPAVA
ncbi:A24 family peptidase [Elioraea thermophila]|uniref:A24 family peptidase n=1 Tax=Elioraea thermophila TaxID=2185104 RepID=UPI000DF1B24E|nr:prepilin peptidase [Elioraea thermophila]